MDRPPRYPRHRRWGSAILASAVSLIFGMALSENPLQPFDEADRAALNDELLRAHGFEPAPN